MALVHIENANITSWEIYAPRDSRPMLCGMAEGVTRVYIHATAEELQAMAIVIADHFGCNLVATRGAQKASVA